MERKKEGRKEGRKDGGKGAKKTISLILPSDQPVTQRKSIFRFNKLSAKQSAECHKMFCIEEMQIFNLYLVAILEGESTPASFMSFPFKLNLAISIRFNQQQA